MHTNTCTCLDGTETGWQEFGVAAARPLPMPVMGPLDPAGQREIYHATCKYAALGNYKNNDSSLGQSKKNMS